MFGPFVFVFPRFLCLFPVFVCLPVKSCMALLKVNSNIVRNKILKISTFTPPQPYLSFCLSFILCLSAFVCSRLYFCLSLSFLQSTVQSCCCVKHYVVTATTRLSGILCVMLFLRGEKNCVFAIERSTAIVFTCFFSSETAVRYFSATNQQSICTKNNNENVSMFPPSTQSTLLLCSIFAAVAFYQLKFCLIVFSSDIFTVNLKRSYRLIMYALHYTQGNAKYYYCTKHCFIS